MTAPSATGMKARETMSDETTLLSCPFCGGEAELTTFGFSWEPLAYGVRCIADAKRGFDAHGHQIAGFGSAEKAIAAWNSRAERTCECVAEYTESPIDGKKIVLHRCSACHGLMRPHMRHCPNCGARTVGE